MTVLESIYNVYGYQHPGNPAQPPACILRSSQTFHDSQASEHSTQGVSISSVKQSGLPKKSAGGSNTDSGATSDNDDVEREKLHNVEKEIGQGRAVGEEERGEEREEEREETDSDGERLRILYDCLQEYFRFFFTCMTLVSWVCCGFFFFFCVPQLHLWGSPFFFFFFCVPQLDLWGSPFFFFCFSHLDLWGLPFFFFCAFPS